MNETLANWIASSQAREGAIYLLRNVPGMPPITQSLHILGIAAVMGSIVMIDLRILGLAVRSQNLSEMIRRLMPWTWWALVLNLTTGLPFILARPYRYFLNPVFGWKIAFLVPAVLLAAVLYLLNRRETGFWERSLSRRVSARVIAVTSLTLWIGVVLAGRWIAYSDYLFWPE